MKKSVLRIFMYAALALNLMFAINACNKDEMTDDDYINVLATETVGGLELRSRSFSHGCFELVFPVNIKMPDGMIKIAENNDSLKRLLRGFCMADNALPKPELVFPIEIKAQDGTVMKVASLDELKALRKECFRNMLDSLRHKEKGGRSGDSLCFTLVFPIEVKKPDGSLVKVLSKEELKSLIKNEARTSHGKKNKIEIVFPVEVRLTDGMTKILNSESELKALIRSCEDD